MKVVKKYGSFNSRRYGNPWVALVNKSTGKIDFSQKIGGYTGGHNKGEAGDLYIIEPVEGAVYAYGQKDHRGNGTELEYIQYVNGAFIPVDKTELINTLSD